MTPKRLKAVFIGSKNDFDQLLVHWLSQRVDVAAVVWTRSSDWQRSWSGRAKFAWKRYRRYGLLKLMDELLFFLYYHAFRNRASEAELAQKIIRPYVDRNRVKSWNGDAISADDVNAADVRQFVWERHPDIAFAMCVNNYFGKRLRAIPRLGVFLWHEGVTPEYRGLYAPFWAAYNLDFKRIGYTLLRMNDRYDAGEVFVQGSASGVDPFLHTHDYMGHKAVLDSLPQVERLISELHAGTARAIDRAGAQSQLYTYPGISDLIWQRIRLRKWRSIHGPTSTRL